MASPASTPASTPTRTHVTNIVKLMTPPPSSLRYDAPASLPPHRCTRSASSPFAPAGRTSAPAAEQGLRLPELAKASDRGALTTVVLLAGERRQVADGHLVDANREVGFELAGKDVEVRRAAFHEQDLDGLLDGGRPNAGHGQ